jgi:sigma-B regulation protein RsbU (phosphoserine phosphatase)
MVFVVDDDLTTNRMLQRILSRAGFQTACAFSVAEAVGKIDEIRPDLVLLDVNLPDGQGFDVCRRLQISPGPIPTPVLFISANIDVATKLQGFEAGGVDYITKPLAGAEVLARVSTHLRLKQAYERLAELQAEQIQRLVGAQETLMPSPRDCPEASFHISLDQILKAGGDFYDVIPVGNQVIDYIVADASGHDLAASFWTAALKTLLGEYATAAAHPREVMRAINGALCRILPTGTFFTLLYARLNRQIGRLTLVNAGHPPVIALHHNNHGHTIAFQDGDVAGAFPDAEFGTLELVVQPEDRFFLYSDGLIELNGSRQDGISSLAQSCNAYRNEPLEKAVASIRSEVVAGATLQDDILLMGVDV